MELHTDRLRLRPFSKKDYGDVQAYAGDPDVAKYMIWGPNTLKETKEFISRVLDANARLPRRDYDFVLERRDSGRPIGACGLYLREKEEAEVGWVLHKDYWKNGYMSEAARALIDFGFSALKLHRIYATCFAENYGSFRVMENCGMRREAEYKKSRRLRSDPDGVWYDNYLYAILYEEWEQRSKNDR